MAKTMIPSLALLLVFPVVYGANIYVGDDGSSYGWNDFTDYGTWVRGQETFTTKDLLVFQFSGRHSVAEVNETQFNYCDSSEPIYWNDTSPVTFPLTTPGKRYFICPTFGHCAEGMKVSITVTDGDSEAPSPPSRTTRSPPPPSQTTPSPPSRTTRSSDQASGTTPSPPSPSGATAVLACWKSLFVGVLFGVLGELVI